MYDGTAMQDQSDRGFMSSTSRRTHELAWSPPSRKKEASYEHKGHPPRLDHDTSETSARTKSMWGRQPLEGKW